MATPTRRKPPLDTRRARPAVSPAAANQLEVIDPRWLLRAGAVTLLAALFCAWLTLCLLVYQGQWQLVLHPEATAPGTQPTAALPFQPVRFGAAPSGRPALAGWWIPAPGGSRTILFLHDGSGNLASNLAPLEALQAAGLSVFAFDYRGFGASESTHPNQRRMTEDAVAALDYLTGTRHIPIQTIIPYGAGLGASLAVQLAAAHPGLPAVIVESPDPDVLKFAHGDSRGSLVPLSLLFQERFEIGPTLSTLKTPKLLLTSGPSPVAVHPSPASLDTLFRNAAPPSRIVHLDNPANTSAWTEALTRFLEEYAQ
jgi:pimeloyl-ACP methyl ester carboxylesterase